MPRKTLIIFFVVVLCASVNLKAQIGDTFPSIAGITLTDQRVEIPADTKGKFTLIGMSYSKKSESELKTWFQPVYQKFIHKPKKKQLFDFSYDVNVYFIPMFTGVNKAAAGTVMKKMRKNSDPELEPYIVFYKGELKKYKQQLDFERRDTPYFFVLNEEGRIVYATSGGYSDDKMDSIEDLLESD